MKQVLMLATSLFLFAGTAFSQAYEGKADYQKAQQPAAIAEFPYSSGMVENAIKDKLEKQGYGGKESKGFRIFRGVRVPEISSDPVDLYFKVDRKSRREKDASMVYLMVSKGNDSISGDAQLMSNARSYLNNLKPAMDGYSLELQIAEQESQVKKNEKKFDNLVDDGTSLEQRQILETLKTKRKQ
jgi:hypothetical protein